MDKKIETKIFTDVVSQLNQIAVNEGFEVGNLQKIRSKGKKRVSKKIFTKRSTFADYAYHGGGRAEIQFNIGLEKKGNGVGLFRYGIAFSLKRTKSLQKPVDVLKPRIYAFNEFLRNNLDALNENLVCVYGDPFVSKRKLQKIPDVWIQEGNFIFIGQYLEKNIRNITLEDMRGILKVMDSLIPAYEYVENQYKQFISKDKDRISKICWNHNGWKKPSGLEGKSKDKNSYERQHRYGHEEWLFDFDKTVEGYHYAYLQPIGKYRNKYEGNTYNITLYSVNSQENNQSNWVGNIKNIEVIGRTEEARVIRLYKEKGWLDDMLNDLNYVNADTKDFKKWVKSGDLFNIRFRPEDAYWYDSEPVPFKDNERIKHTRYTLLRKDFEPALSPQNDLVYSGKTRKNTKNENKQIRRQKVIECSQLHDQIQNSFINYLQKKYPGEMVELETKTAYGAFIDIIRETVNGQRIVYEVKTYLSAKSCIREAIGQLLEYGYYPNMNIADELVIVSQAPLQDSERVYIKHLRDKLSLTLRYVQFDHASSFVLEEV